ncbi:acyl-CoA thioesterase [Paraburkholderia sp. ZP32-5]|uniref:acyl-CoA thioesterase n=1 Tax=Paraburkholderia sp. ZP32-5 TaxID=2883245 RepID=UPI001F1C11A7|nr:acyl-CoA thioesterase domain-containing protein [Paraburkholderia sp. ZP32-5]
MRLNELRASRPEYDDALHDTAHVLDMLNIERLGSAHFRGSANSGRPRIFGGLLVAQALMAASKTTTRRPHVLHAMFVDAGREGSIDYAVETLRDGGTFTSCRVAASQGGRTIFQMFASFQDDEPGLAHQTPFPLSPEESMAGDACEIDNTDLVAWGPRWKHEAELAGTRFYRAPVEFFTSGWDPYENDRPGVERHILTRTPIALPAERGLHDALFAYLSDYCLLFAALQPHGIGRSDKRLQRASLDHSIWFHRPLRADEWLFHQMTSPSASGGRGLSQSAVYDLAGNRVATVMQEALIRLR